MIAALNRPHELRLHIRGALNNGITKDELIKIIGDYDGLAVRSATKADKDVLAAATRLKVLKSKYR